MISALLIGLPIALYLSGEGGANFVSLFILLPGMILLGGFIGLLNDNPFSDDFSIFDSVAPTAVLVPLVFFGVLKSL